MVVTVRPETPRDFSVAAVRCDEVSSVLNTAIPCVATVCPGDNNVHVEVAEISDVKIRAHGNTAVVTGAYHEKGTSKGKPYEYRDRYTDIWMSIGGNWQLIASHFAVPFKG